MGSSGRRLIRRAGSFLLSGLKAFLEHNINLNLSADHAPDDVYVMEVWDSKEDHDDPLKLPGVRERTAQAMPILAGKLAGITLEVLGGKGVAWGGVGLSNLPEDDIEQVGTPVY